ncbi:MAG TPA: 4Fe-4S dicluster domain-containing protein [Kiritimatiellia bacterium]|nr:4Fe-4S dicluster domain-containing protein [Kiritimatiellia bacterium]
MSIKKLQPQALAKWVGGILQKQKVQGIQAKGDRFAFAPLARAEDLRLDYDVALTAPKEFFQPQREVLLKFRGEAYESELQNEPFVLFGVHPYDMVAILQMDAVFSSGNYDVHYMDRRRQATIVVCDAQNASPNVFAGCMGTATLDTGYDVLVTKVDGEYVVESKSEKGEALVKGLAGESDADAQTLKMRDVVREHSRKLLRRHELRVKPQDLPALLEQSYDHPVWEEKARKCFSCGSCNLVCPTCYCFNVRDDVNWDLKSGERVRVWDGCMLAEFAKVAGGHNFRKKKAERYRHRYYRKGKYLWDLQKQIACVGCGRCISACVTKIANPVEIYNRLAEGK